jgi:hypothetical protein
MNQGGNAHRTRPTTQGVFIMGSVVNSIFGGGNITSLVTSAISAIYPPAAIAMGVANLVTQAVGGAVNEAVNQLTKQSGMPSFLQDPIRSMIESVVKELTQGNDPECDEAAKEGFGKDIQDMMSQWASSIAQQTCQYLDEEGGVSGGKGKSSGESWLVAMAKAMGSIAGKHAAELQKLSKAMDNAGSAEGGGASQEFMELQSKFQAESQLFGMLQNSFANAIKTIGEGLTTMARKG